MRKRILSILIALCMTTCLLGAMSTTVSAAAPTAVYVGGVDVIGGGYWVSDGAGGIKADGASSSNYTVEYASGKLTLNNANITKCFDWSSNYTAAIYANGDLNIELLDDNSVTSKTYGYSYGVCQTNGTLTISGSGSLTATAGTANIGYSGGIWADSLVVGGGTIIAKGGRAKDSSYGIHTFNALSITDGTVTATGEQTTFSSAYESSYGLGSNGNINISGGSVTATAGDAYYRSSGVYSSYAVTVSGNAVLLATGSTATATDGSSNGIYSGNSSIVFSGGAVTAKSGTAPQKSAIGTAPNLTGYTGYEWRISEGDGFSTGTYTWSADHTYVQFRRGFVPVTDIIITSTTSVAVDTDLALAGVVVPANATNKTIEWSVQDDGGTGAAIGSGVFRATSVGTATLKATITNGSTTTEDYIRPFTITVTATPSSASGSTSDSTSSNAPLYSSTDPSTGIRAEGSISGGISVYLLTRTATGRANEVVDPQTYNQLLQAVGNGYTPVCAYNVTAQGYNGMLTLTFPVGTKHNGKAFLVKHKTSSGTMESFTGTVADGKVVITVSSLSPFMIAIKEGVQIPETGILRGGRMPMEFIMGFLFQLFSYHF